MSTPNQNENHSADPASPPVSCSAALLEIIGTCEDFQNMDTEGMDPQEECDAGYRMSMKVIVIAAGMLAELEARQNDTAQRRGPAAAELNQKSKT